MATIQATAPSDSGVYQILNAVTGMIYIGSSQEMKKRIGCHLNHLRAETHPNPHLQGSFRKHGEDAFLFIPFHFCKPDDLEKAEQYWIDATRAVDTGYNICYSVVSCMKGRKHSKEVREKLSKSHKGNHYPRMSEAAKKRDPSTRASGPRTDRIMYRCRVCGTWREMMYSRYMHQGNPKYCSQKCYKSAPISDKTRAKLSAQSARVWRERNKTE